ncbi:MAG: enoyl-CoA hydratase/isomerase family protein [Acidimicrobiia bacterium]|nr:enoyl-CoA hydratase/isomerase family protein [Acidimicrobiia bacterium]
MGVVTLDRGERHNALNNAMGSELGKALRWALTDPEVRCVLLRAEGPSFSSGRDTKELGTRSGGESDFSFVRRVQEGRLATLNAPKPVVAAVQGYVLGGAFEMVLSADVRIAADDATFAFPEIQFGLVTDTGGSQLLTMLAGPAKAKYLIISGDRIDAATAHSWGVVDFVVPRSELDGAGLALARRMAAAPPHAAAVAKQLVDQAWAGTIQNGIRAELLAQTALFAGEEHRRVKAARIEELRGARERG